ncbi:MAG TPA: PIN domain-containing protein [Verrucomicrobiae bacterium]|nr:PIN domain-containing protein [Verrucomicrobiae bacterium]
MVLVDSSIWIEAARRQGDLGCKVALEALLEEYEAAFCSPVRFEVLGGARKEERSRMAAGFAVVPYIEVTETTWKLALEMGWRLHDAGTHVPWNDLLVASLSIERGCRVFARDRHFDLMAQTIGIRLYQAGYGGSFAAE